MNMIYFPASLEQQFLNNIGYLMNLNLRIK